jgi:segregation and condensation protein B
MGLRSLDDLPALAPHLPEVDELEAELSQLARPQAVPDDTPDSTAEAVASPATAPSDAGQNDQERENSHG